jgi:phage shock protein PspC (stress-responsive transcriptional regulator)
MPTSSEPRLPVATAPPPPRLWRSASNRVVLGVIGGLAEKFGWEAKPLRILAGLLGVLTLPLGALPVILPYVTIWAITRTHGVSRPTQPLRRSRDHQVVAGVLGGAAEWLGMSPAVVRTTYAALTVATFGLPGIVTYLIMWSKTPLAERVDR